MIVNIKLYVISFFVVLISFSCVQRKWEKNDFNITVNTVSENKVVLEFELSSTDSMNLILDWKALSYQCFYDESEDLLSRLDYNVFTIHDSIRHSQFLIENSSNRYRFFSEKRFFSDTWEQVIDVNCMDDWKDHFVLPPNHTKIVTSDPINIQDLWVNRGDRKVRLHYLFKPTAQEREEGIEPVVLTSNWFYLPKKKE